MATSGQTVATDRLSDEEIAIFQRDGFLVVRDVAPPELLHRLGIAAETLIQDRKDPVEYEAAVGYPGAPESAHSLGGQTLRRVRQVVGRDPVFLEWAQHPAVVGRLQQLLGPKVVLPLAHHNCLMVKDPKFSSDTGWHRDMRYWRFARPELVSVLLALGVVTADTGSLLMMPGSHRVQLEPEQLDEVGFLRTDTPKNKALLDSVVETNLGPGDAIFFHCQTFHAARRNRSDQPRRSLIFTYRAADNLPAEGSRSSSLPEIEL